MKLKILFNHFADNHCILKNEQFEYTKKDLSNFLKNLKVEKTKNLFLDNLNTYYIESEVLKRDSVAYQDCNSGIDWEEVGEEYLQDVEYYFKEVE